MKLFDPKKKRESAKKAEKPSAPVSTEEKKESVQVSKSKRAVGSYIVKSPLLTEKASRLEAHENKYVFLVHPTANKTEIQKEIERLFNVGVTGVAIINQPRKKRIWRGHAGYSTGEKKAIVTIEKGKKIEILPT